TMCRGRECLGNPWRAGRREPGVNGTMWIAQILTLATAALLANHAEAVEAHEKSANILPERLLLFSGTDISSVSSFAWIGADISLLDKRSISGPVLRITGGAGRYEYDNHALDH